MKFKTLAFLLIFTFMADAGIGMLPTPYPVEIFSGDPAFPVLKVIDGDTVEIQYNGNLTKVRLIGVDTPETVHPSKPAGPHPGLPIHKPADTSQPRFSLYRLTITKLRSISQHREQNIIALAVAI